MLFFFVLARQLAQALMRFPADNCHTVNVLNVVAIDCGHCQRVCESPRSGQSLEMTGTRTQAHALLFLDWPESVEDVDSGRQSMEM